MYLIAISGKIGVGKTTIAQKIIAALDSGWQRTSFAILLKEEVAERFHFDVRLAYSTAGKETVIKLPDGSRKTVRELLQWYGTDVVRAKDRDYWIRAMGKHLAVSKGKVDGLVIDDVRFPNEANLVRLHKGFLVRVEPYQGYVPLSDHASETALDNYRSFALILRPEYGEAHLHQAAEQIIVSAKNHFTILPRF